MLTERNRYRLTGTIFLIAVAAVVLPMLFDGEGVAPMQLDPVPPAEFEVERDDLPPPDMTPALEAREDLKAAIDEDGYAVDTGTRVGEPTLLDEEREETSELKWAVQVAAFMQSENATALRDKLLGDGYAAFLSNVKRHGEITTRVAVGPFINRDDAERLMAELNERYEFTAMIVRFGH